MATRAATRSSATSTVLTANFPSTLQASASSPSSCNQSQPKNFHAYGQILKIFKAFFH